jgi:hypothetical protein
MTNQYQVTGGEFEVLRLALGSQLSATWSAPSPCAYRETQPPLSGAYVKTPSGCAVTFTVLGRDFAAFFEPAHALQLVDILRAYGVYTEPSTPNSDRSQVYLGIAGEATRERYERLLAQEERLARSQEALHAP